MLGAKQCMSCQPSSYHLKFRIYKKVIKKGKCFLYFVLDKPKSIDVHALFINIHVF